MGRLNWRYYAVGAATLCLTVTGAVADELRIGGTGAGLGTARLLGVAYTATHRDVSISVTSSLGSSGGIKAVMAGALDIALSARALNPNERAAGLAAYAYGETPLVWVTDAARSESDIDTATLQALYRGETRRWQDGQVMRVVLRPAADSDTMLLRDYVPELREVVDQALANPGMPLAVSDQEAVQLVRQLPGGIVTSTLALLKTEQPHLKALRFNEVEPTVANLTNRRYTMGKTLYMVVGAAPSETVLSFIQFLCSERAHAILRDSGHRVLPLQACRAKR